MLVNKIRSLLFCGLFAVLSFGGIQAKPIVIALNGTSSSGKSSIARELIHLLNTSVCVEGSGIRQFHLLAYDEFYAEEHAADATEAQEEKENSSSQDDDDDRRSSADHNSSASSLDGRSVGESVQLDFFNEVLRCVIAGGNVVVDSMFDKTDQALFKKILSEYASIQFVSVYCSPRALVDRVRHRNTLQTLNEQRSLYQAALQISDLWKISVGCDSDGALVVDRVSLDDLHFVVDSVRHELTEPPAQAERVLWGLEGRLVPISPVSSDFTAGTEFVVTPRVRSSCVVDSGRNTPDVCAGQIVDSVRHFLGQ